MVVTTKYTRADNLNRKF